MKSSKLDGKASWRSTIRAIKTVFFLITMTLSFLVFSAPILLVIADALLPSALLSASLPPTTPNRSDFLSSLLGDRSISSFLRDYDFRYSLVDIPLLSIARSILILCVYSWCDGPRMSRGPYLWVATVCSAVSLVFVSLKASFVFGRGGYDGARAAEVALFCSSYALAVGHVLVAYRTSCRERKKLLIYKIDIEARASPSSKQDERDRSPPQHSNTCIFTSTTVI
ncbi:hypothetical protein V2J09_012515 [Rumex salicifolius]